MALIINSSPETIVSAYRPICWDISTDDPTVIKLKVEHVIDGDLVATTFHLPTIGTTDNFIIDGSNIASNFVTYDIADYGGASNVFNSEKEYGIIAYEIDNTFSELTNEEPNTIFINNIPLQHNDPQTLTGFELLDDESCYLSRMGDKSTAYRGQVIPINALTVGFTDAHIRIEGFVAGVSQGVVIDPLEISGNRGVYYLDTESLFAADVDSFVFEIADDALLTANISKVYSFKLKPSCNEHCEVYFLNCLGGFDSFMFTGDKSTKFNVKRKRFKGSIGKDFNVRDRGQSVLGTKSVQEIELFSRFLNESESAMLSDLIHSPEVFIVENNNLVPVVVKDGSYTTKSSKGLIQYKVVLEYANNKIVACV